MAAARYPIEGDSVSTNPIEQAVEVILANDPSEYDVLRLRDGERIANALADAGLLKTQADMDVIAAAEAWKVAKYRMHVNGGEGFKQYVLEGRMAEATLSDAVARLRAAREETRNA